MRTERDRIITLLWIVVAAVGVALCIRHMLGRYEPAAPHYFWAFPLIALLAVLFVWRTGKRNPVAILPTLKVIPAKAGAVRVWLKPLPFAMGLVGVSLLLLAMARPQSKDSWKDEKREGIDIVIALDISTSMLAKDLRPDRLEASKRVGVDFINGRPDDRIGLVVYEGEAYTQCPLTSDHRVLKDLFMQPRPGLIDGGTAIGMGLATALNRLRDSEAKSKVVILLTDGVSNAGMVQPLDAARMAASLGIRVYTIGVGTRGKALSPVDQYANGQYRYDYVDVELDEEVLKQMAELGGGRYFRATDEEKLREIYREIDRMEKTLVKVTEHSSRTEEFLPYAAAGASLLLLGFLFDRSILRTMA